MSAPNVKERLAPCGLHCGGCRVEKCKFYKNCKVRSCAQEKRVDFCCDCPEFPLRPYWIG
ncbi:DUF3795 domain-containing protein [Oscillospiraceae bacterium 50-60]